MPPLELVVPESFLFIPANLSYISFCFFISFLIYRLSRSFIVFFIALLGFLSLMYSDLIFKHVIKNYYEIVQKNRTIYSYPIKNDEGKIDSLSTVRVYNYPLYKSTLSQTEKDNIVRLHESYINKFIDITTVRYRFNKYIYNEKRVFLNVYKYDNSFLEDEKQKARYTITKVKKESYFKKLYEEFEYRFIDTNSNLIIGTAYSIKFLNSTNKLRNRFLYWSKEKEEEFNINSIQNFDTVYKKLFID
ncbi:hypothetical protein LPB137_10015 [Poseidonibacter parvus]|uniref:Uncharacterized protein n=2 Tax=Poseidonibacter parvus TaxID=1850254 RepID=A0A1P8KNN9_9BACT|nr:hypothetical protein LPB137_10015 [Poseidonibacter parvus]